ncbi:MAG: ribonuclease H-like domain-containing protein [Acidobacteria bacterium]|nr:ribonuclease H-like domain-containing protein [Acidobacteriota bacterium]
MQKTLNFGGEIYLDIETLRLAQEVPGEWSNIRQFGLAVAVTWDPEHGFRRWFEEDAANLVAELERFSHIITFNGERFDLEVLRGYRPAHQLQNKSLDLLAHLKDALGFRVKLDSLAEETLGRRKTGSGVEVVSWWRAGLKEKVCKYCENDVQLLVDLVAYARENGHVKVDGKLVPVNWR